MARNNLAYGQTWRTRNGNLIVLGSITEHKDPIVADMAVRTEGREWFLGSNGFVYCNVHCNGRMVFPGVWLNGADLMALVG